MTTERRNHRSPRQRCRRAHRPDPRVRGGDRLGRRRDPRSRRRRDGRHRRRRLLRALQAARLFDRPAHRRAPLAAPEPFEPRPDRRRTTMDVSAESFETAVIERSRELPVIVDFWAPWCGPCHALAPVLEQEVERRGGAVELVKVNVDDSPELASRFAVSGIPSVKAFSAVLSSTSSSARCRPPSSAASSTRSWTRRHERAVDRRVAAPAARGARGADRAALPRDRGADADQAARPSA